MASTGPMRSSIASIRLMVALVVLLATAAVAVIVSRSDREPEARPTVSPSVTTAPSPTPPAIAELDGKGPYILYAMSTSGPSEPRELFAYDVGSGKAVFIGNAFTPSSDGASIQPDSGKMIAFAGTNGSIWRIDRAGLHWTGSLLGSGRNEQLRTGEDVSLIPPSLEGSSLSSDLRYLAVGVQYDEPATIVIDLRTSKQKVVRQADMGVGDVDALIPVAWGVDAATIYQFPICHCGGGTPGLFRFDVATGRSRVLEATRDEFLYRRVVASPDGRTLVYGSERDFVPCSPGGEPLCSGPPFELRRLSADGTSWTALRSSNDAWFEPLVISHDGRLVLVRRYDQGTQAARLEMIDTRSGERVGPSGTLGVSRRAIVRSILPDGSFVAYNDETGRIIVVRDGRATIAARRAGWTRPIQYLGWIL
jgi:hypothetical protein